MCQVKKKKLECQLDSPVKILLTSITNKKSSWSSTVPYHIYNKVPVAGWHTGMHGLCDLVRLQPSKILYLRVFIYQSKRLFFRQVQEIIVVFNYRQL